MPHVDGGLEALNHRHGAIAKSVREPRRSIFARTRKSPRRHMARRQTTSMSGCELAAIAFRGLSVWLRRSPWTPGGGDLGGDWVVWLPTADLCSNDTLRLCDRIRIRDYEWVSTRRTGVSGQEHAYALVWGAFAASVKFSDLEA